MQKDEHLEYHGGYERTPPATASAGRGEAHSTATHAVAKHKLPLYHRFARMTCPLQFILVYTRPDTPVRGPTAVASLMSPATLSTRIHAQTRRHA